ncbi:MAG: hypothetical protein IJA12_06880 [Oscillospiraceae bacterium]|nr:hypothetical protein [Oscillospiraceae bacterium]
MSQLSRFLKTNKKAKENTVFVATRFLTDENGNPLEWVIKPITTKENDEIRDSCMMEIPDKNNGYRTKLDFTKYRAKVLCASVAEPNLESTELQTSYGVTRPEDLIREMIDDPGEYDSFFEFVSKFNGFNKNADEEIEEAKN